VVCLLFSVPTHLIGQSGAKNGEWRSYAGDGGSTRYSPLDQISATNFNKLLAFKLPDGEINRTRR
jgi:glucose dehydrogenase